MARPYEITPLSSNKTILQIVKGIAEHLSKNPLYKVIFYNGAFVSGTLTYSKSNLKQVANNVLETNDVIVFNNSFFAVIDAVGDETFTIVDPYSFKGDKGDKGNTGSTGQTGATGNGIVSVTKTGTSGLDDTYTILYTNGTTSTFVVTNGAKGDTGNGIVSVTKTGTSGLVDTYTILFTNGTTTSFELTNGADGQDGATGNGIASIEKTGTSGLVDTYTITFTNGTTTTFEVTNGSNGQTTLYLHSIEISDQPSTDAVTKIYIINNSNEVININNLMTKFSSPSIIKLGVNYNGYKDAFVVKSDASWFANNTIGFYNNTTFTTFSFVPGRTYTDTRTQL